MPILPMILLLLLALFVLLALIETWARMHRREWSVRLTIGVAILLSLGFTLLGGGLTLAISKGEQFLSNLANIAGPLLLLFNGVALWILLKKPVPVLNAAELRRPPSLLLCLFGMNFYLVWGAGHLVGPAILPPGNGTALGRSYALMTAFLTLLWVVGAMILLLRRHRSLRKDRTLVPMIGKFVLLFILVSAIQALFMSQEEFQELENSPREAASLGEGIALMLLSLSELRLLKEIGWTFPSPQQDIDTHHGPVEPER